MPNKDSSFADFTRSCDKLLTATEEHVAVLPSAGPYRTALQQVFADVRELKAHQDSLLANRQEATQDLGAIIAQCQEAVMRLRAAVRADLGPYSELLVQFGVAPLRPRKRRAGRSDPQPPAPEAQPPAVPNA